MKYSKIILLFLFTCNLYSQPGIKYSSVEIETALKKLNVLGSVLYIAAHPDDENEAFLAYMAQGRLYQTAYLSLTRGDGGQNLLGPEKGSLLGAIRTLELLDARGIDDAQQFFTRAIDFGYCKSSQEALKKWDPHLLLGDVVSVIRQRRPDVIVTRFSEQWGGHGHHIASAILAKEAFSASAYTHQFPEQLDNLKAWQPKRLMWNTWRPQQNRPENSPPPITLDYGEYNPLLGMSYEEVAAESRSMHKTQGFGSSPRMGKTIDYFEHTSGDIARNDLFDGIETTWKRVPGCDDIQKKVDKLIAGFNPENPQNTIPGLIDLYKHLDQKGESYWIEIKKKEVKNLLQKCSGLWLDAIALDKSVTPGKNIKIKTSILNRSDYGITLKKTAVTYAEDSLYHMLLENDIVHESIQTAKIPENCDYTQPYWLKKPASETIFNVSKDFTGAAVGSADLQASFTVEYDDLELEYKIPVLYKWNDSVKGEQYQPFPIVPDISISLSQNAYISAGKQSKDVAVTIVADRDSVAGEIRLNLPEGWSITPQQHTFSLEKRDQQAIFVFKVTPQKNAVDGNALCYAMIKNKRFDHQVIKLAYDHIPHQNVLVPSEAKLVNLDITVPKKRIAYIMGTGDEIPQSLREIGIQVDILSEADLKTVDYNNYDAVVCGVRAFNALADLALLQNRIIDYVKMGGTWIVQHNTRFGYQVKNIGPYPFTAQGRSRISEEDTPVKILEPTNPVMNYPNKITLHDFDGWVQERGTYLAETWDKNFVPLLSGHDAGEMPQDGGLLYSTYGKGIYIYTAMSWFRQLPAGVPGAYRIFVNMICAADYNNKTASKENIPTSK